MNSKSFRNLSLKPALLENLDSLQFTEMTPVQAQSLPVALAGGDLIAQAKTGSGKTAAFGLGLLQKLDADRFRIQSLVLCPTRELADQVAKDLRRLARTIHNIKILTLCGGMPFGPQIGSLEHGAHVIVGTPGRVEEHVRKGSLKLNDVNLLVLDEADRMLDMGFQETLDAILAEVPKQRQTLLFSATYPAEIQQMAERVMSNPIMIRIEEQHDNHSIEQIFYEVSDHQDRLQMLRLTLAKFRPTATLVFCNTKRETDEVADWLTEQGYSALPLHGDMEQRQRDLTLVRFANKSASILVATDVAARGLDITDLDAVINFHISKDPEVHTHRVGRTGRAGSKGLAISFYTEREAHKIARLPLSIDPIADPVPRPADSFLDEPPLVPAMVTLQIDGGKKQKVRPGDILGALTGGPDPLVATEVGKISIFDQSAYFAVSRSVAKRALKKIEQGKLKGRSFRVRLIRG